MSSIYTKAKEYLLAGAIDLPAPPSTPPSPAPWGLSGSGADMILDTVTAQPATIVNFDVTLTGLAP